MVGGGSTLGLTWLALSGCVFLFFWTASLLRHTLLRGSPRPSVLVVSNNLVSALQRLEGVAAFVSGVAIVRGTRGNVMWDRHWLATSYPWACLGYGLYDIWAMFYVFAAKNPQVLQRGGWAGLARACVGTRTSMFLHHMGILLVGFPATVWWRGEKGDFFVGCLLGAEVVVPLVGLRACLAELDLRSSRLYVLNGLAMIAVFFVARILLFPFMMGAYAEWKGIPLLSVPGRMPPICLVFCSALFALQAHWLAQMLLGAKRVLWDGRSDVDPPLQHPDEPHHAASETLSAPTQSLSNGTTRPNLPRKAKLN